MAIFHLSVKVISRAAGRSAVAAAAYRSADRLHDERLDRAHDFTNKSGVVHSEVLLPDNAPDAWHNRERLWNDVEAFEKRKDAQLSREAEFAIPREMNQQQGVELVRDFVQREFVEAGMIADLNVHWDIGADGLAKPHAHVMLTMREIVIDADGKAGFGAKVREWNRTELVEQWRERWAEHVNERLAVLDIDARVDHRSLAAQGIALQPQDKIGPAASRMDDRGLEAERIAEHREIALRNGERIIAEPRIALDAITHHQATFTNRDLALFAHRHSDGREQFDAVMGAVRSSPDLVELGKDGRGEDRFTSRDMIETEQRLHRAAEVMEQRERHRVANADRKGALARAAERGLVLSGEQRAAFDRVTDGRDLGVVVGYAGTGKSAMLGAAREAWESGGLNVRGAALSGIAAEGLEHGSGIASRTIASLEHGWAQGRDLLTARDVLVIDEAGMVGTRQMERVLSHAAEAGAKVVLVGDPQQLQSIEAGAAFRSLHERHGGVEIGEVRRQHEGWQREATRDLATGRTGGAIRAYDEAGMVHGADTRAGARDELIERWDRDRQAAPDASRIILTHTNDEVRMLNEAARERMGAAGDLGEDVAIKTERGDRSFASGDRIMFLRNERSLGVKNGTLGTIERVSGQHMAVRTDDGRSVAFDVKDYRDLDHGYAATIHKAQGMTVDRTHVLATPGMDSHSAYVAMSRHRDGVTLHYGRDEFRDQNKLVQTLSRERAKDMAQDYGKTDPARAFAERRGISVRERVAEIVRKTPEKARSIFAGFKPTVNRSSIEPRDTPRTDNTQRAVERYARAQAEIDGMREKQLPVLPHQREALDKAGAALDACRPHGRTDLAAAFERQPELVRPAAQGNTQTAVRAMQLEAEIRIDPARRADRFTGDWQQLHEQRAALNRKGDHDAARRIGGQMGAMAKSLERDAQVESILSARKSALGIDARSVRSIRQDLADIAKLGLDRSRGIGIGM
ncbi:Ti-type conjugative transfer relaxase TraA [Sphingopyxis witflariensis]|uniref:Ti-type conjugative transfer relaxase TraA n=1 Tax=Sphingopyxis witflariensis TaxID=173675 RepID=A0A246K3N9_9SPHN|nr:Ti-type conjugative transfer relaxase TraA [Sphingopyxis witflariensis]OWR00215.1 Ti-type conjugative transfer relaxase TraA [Sphingopyxis witflariensis]